MPRTLAIVLALTACERADSRPPEDRELVGPRPTRVLHDAAPEPRRAEPPVDALALPSPDPPAPPQNVAPTMLEQQRIGGARNIEPDAATRAEMIRDGIDRAVMSIKVCVDTGGGVTNTAQLKSSKYRAYDLKIENEIRLRWKYRPFLVNTKAVPVCTAYTFIYRP